MKVKCPACKGTGFEDGIEGLDCDPCSFCDGTAWLTFHEWLSLKKFIFNCRIAEKTRIVFGPPCEDCRLCKTFRLAGNADICGEAHDDGRNECWLPIGKYLKYRKTIFIQWLQED